MIEAKPVTDAANGPDWPRSVLALAFNLIPLAGVAFWGWSPFELIFLYWLENVAIGIRTFIAILLSGRFHGAAGSIATATFFAVHYGIFCAVHGIFVVTMFGGEFSGAPVNFANVANTIGLAVLAMGLWQLALLAMQVASGDRSTPLDLMGSPYPRIIVLHITILGGGFLLMALNWPYAGVVVLAVLKAVMDAAMALRSGRAGASEAKPAGLSPPSSPPRP